MTILLVLVPLLLAAAEPPVSEQAVEFPQQLSANALLAACASSSLTGAGRQRRQYCAGFISGVEEAVRILQTQHRLEASVCLPDGVSAKRLAAVFVRYAATGGRPLDQPAASMVLEALSQAFPCHSQ